MPAPIVDRVKWLIAQQDFTLQPADHVLYGLLFSRPTEICIKLHVAPGETSAWKPFSWWTSITCPKTVADRRYEFQLADNYIAWYWPQGQSRPMALWLMNDISCPSRITLQITRRV